LKEDTFTQKLNMPVAVLAMVAASVNVDDCANEAAWNDGGGEADPVAAINILVELKAIIYPMMRNLIRQ
jgi:hypothetical protein